MRSILIQTGAPYEVKIERGLLARCGQELAALHAPCRAALVMDSNVEPLYGDTVIRSLTEAGFEPFPCVFPAGEAAKTMETLSELLERFAEGGLTRTDLVVALGGGVTGDMAGFAAAVYQRGTDYVQLPTTLLAAVDSSVGGKTAVDLRAGKNLAGAFWQPRLVLCDCDAFRTLPPRELAAGAAECVKYAMLGDVQLLELLAADAPDWDEISARCVAAKARFVEADEHDHGLRQMLNLGHTIGHAVERCAGFSIRHGEGVAIGLVAITRAAEALGHCAPGTADGLIRVLERLGLPTTCTYTADALYDAALADKKRRGDTITLVVPVRLGEAKLLPVPLDTLREVIARGVEEKR